MTDTQQGSEGNRLGELLSTADETVATAESCTGGLLGGAITAAPGASRYYAGSITAYSYEAKLRLLGVSRSSLDRHGAVSEPVACEMAERVRDKVDVTWGVGITGVAGPDGGTTETPIGTVYIAIAYAGAWGSDQSYVEAKHYRFDGDRASVRDKTVESAITLLSEHIEAQDD